jgi:hypothetical protein
MIKEAFNHQIIPKIIEISFQLFLKEILKKRNLISYSLILLKNK